MRVYVSVDMEGVAGVATLDQIVRGGTGYPRAQGLMTDEASAAVRGAISGGADEVLVSDSHGTMDNLLHDRIDPRARMVFGAPRDGCMMHGITADFDLAVFVGYHAAAGEAGVLAHSFSMNFTALRVNGETMGEAQVNALYAAAFGVPIGVVTGDDRICAAAERSLPGVRTVAVKQALGFAAADSLAPEAACERIEAAVAKACDQGGAACLRVPDAMTVEADFSLPLAADLAAVIPGTERISGRTVRHVVDHPAALIEVVMSWYHLGGIAAEQVAAISRRR